MNAGDIVEIVSASSAKAVFDPACVTPGGNCHGWTAPMNAFIGNQYTIAGINPPCGYGRGCCNMVALNDDGNAQGVDTWEFPDWALRVMVIPAQPSIQKIPKKKKKAPTSPTMSPSPKEFSQEFLFGAPFIKVKKLWCDRCQRSFPEETVAKDVIKFDDALHNLCHECLRLLESWTANQVQLKVFVGDIVELGEHEEIMGCNNWNENMKAYVGVKTRIIDVGGMDESNQHVAWVEADGRSHEWRVRDMKVKERKAYSV